MSVYFLWLKRCFILFCLQNIYVVVGKGFTMCFILYHIFCLHVVSYCTVECLLGGEMFDTSAGNSDDISSQYSRIFTNCSVSYTHFVAYLVSITTNAQERKARAVWLSAHV